MIVFCALSLLLSSLLNLPNEIIEECYFVTELELNSHPSIQEFSLHHCRGGKGWGEGRCGVGVKEGGRGLRVAQRYSVVLANSKFQLPYALQITKRSAYSQFWV